MMTMTTMTGDATNGFDGLYSYKHPLDGYNNNDNVCSGEKSCSGGGC